MLRLHFFREGGQHNSPDSATTHDLKRLATQSFSRWHQYYFMEHIPNVGYFPTHEELPTVREKKIEDLEKTIEYLGKKIELMDKTLEQILAFTFRRRSLTLKKNLPNKAMDVLQRWYMAHMENPYPTGVEKQQLIYQTSLTAGMSASNAIFS